MARLYLDEVGYSRSERTYRNYRLDIEGRFIPYLERLGVEDIRDLTRAHCTGFISQEGTRGVGPASVRKSFDVMRRWLNWCVESGYLEESPAVKMQAPRAPKAMRLAFTHEEVQAILAATKEGRGFLAFRDYAIALLLLDTGLRAAGLLSLKLSQLAASDYRVHGRLLVREKGDKDRLVRVGRNARKAINAYLAMRPKVSDDALWIDLRRKPMTYSALAAMFNKLAEYSGVADVIAHRFRHTFATEHYRKNRDIIALKSALGHEYIQTTEQYLQALGVDFALQAKDANPGDWLT